MSNRDPMSWMLSEAVESLARAERMHRQFFQLRASGATGRPSWEPPSTCWRPRDEILVFVALPGVDPDHVEASSKRECSVVAGQRVLPPELRNAIIHRLELPQGPFRAAHSLPAGRYSVRSFAANGCLVLHLAKLR